MTCKSAECADLGEGLWHRELPHHADVVSAGADPLMGNMMCEVYNLQLEKQTHRWFQFQIEFMESFKYDVQAF